MQQALSPSSPPPRSSTPLPWGRWSVRSAALTYLVIMLIIPLLVILQDGLREGLGEFWHQISLPVAWSALKLTLWTSAVMTIINTIMGTLTAFVLVRYEFAGKNLLNGLIDLPLAIPTLVTGVMLVVLFGPQEAVGAWLKEQFDFSVIFAPPGIILALLFLTFPFVVRAVQPVLLELDRAQEHAAATLGANGWTIFRRIVLPPLTLPVITGALLSFARAIGEFGSIVIVAGNIPFRSMTAAVYVLGEVESENRLGASAVSIVMVGIAFSLLMFADYLRKRAHAGGLVPVKKGNAMSVTVSSNPPFVKTKAPSLSWFAKHKGKWVQWTLITLVVVYVAFLILTPITALILGALEKGLMASITSLNHPEIFGAFWNTLWISLVVVSIHSVFGTLVAWVFVRHKFPGRDLINGLVDMPFAVSPVVAGYMLLLLFGSNGLLSPVIEAVGIKVAFALPGMVLATLFVTLPFMIRELIPVLESFGIHQEQAAATLGATGWQTFWRVTFPALRWGMIYGVTLTFARALGEFGAVLVVGGGVQGRTETATLFIYRALDERQYIGAYSAALVLGLFSLILVMGSDWLRRRGGGH